MRMCGRRRGEEGGGRRRKRERCGREGVEVFQDYVCVFLCYGSMEGRDGSMDGRDFVLLLWVSLFSCDGSLSSPVMGLHRFCVLLIWGYSGFARFCVLLLWVYIGFVLLLWVYIGSVVRAVDPHVWIHTQS
jgi:hypothetical protein